MTPVVNKKTNRAVSNNTYYYMRHVHLPYAYTRSARSDLDTPKGVA